MRVRCSRRLDVRDGVATLLATMPVVPMHLVAY
ncbi:hypothetical protein FraEuI1c_0594 [Pseudofrankia inefficax]|uniref:Uncharacterized protein n=1 Tax=Pseudofrankia inefficax (strain DSM 45817 / CECT 9037 / DDB 130130 / EuI1c) TaxID=298654 RepID=E3JCH6_PSEI1|nr:hypothetical protein FraEuI1c_0594 [Pseudofrankia inefficax]